MAEYPAANPFLFGVSEYVTRVIFRQELATVVFHSTTAPALQEDIPERIRADPSTLWTNPNPPAAAQSPQHLLLEDLIDHVCTTGPAVFALDQRYPERIRADPSTLRRDPIPQIDAALNQHFLMQHYRGAPAYTTFNKGMFLLRDKIPLIAFVETVGGVTLPNSTAIIEGNQNKVLSEADRRGIIIEYLPVDEYHGAKIISSNHIVYGLVDKVELEEYIYRYKVKRLTKANATFKMTHRKFD